jgi:hypothetical protein
MNITPKHAIRTDTPFGVIRIDVSGFFDRSSLVDHFTELRSMVRTWRSHSRPIRALANTVDLMPHSPENHGFVVSSHEDIYRDGDKVAVLVSSSLVKMQMRRAFNNRKVMEFFMSENAALTWLDPPKHNVVSPQS